MEYFRMFSVAGARRFTSLIGFPMVLASCAVNEPSTPSITTALLNNKIETLGLTDHSTTPHSPPSGRVERPVSASVPTPTVSAHDPPIATIEGRPILRSQVVDPLLKARGVAVLETLLVLDAAERMAAARGLSVTAEDVEREYESALRQLVTPLAAVSPPEFDRVAAERVLETVLVEKGLSRDEFMLGIRRNAFLRAICESEIKVAPEQIEAEFRQKYGERIQVRQIQVASLADAGRIRERVAAGEDFAALAREYSANSVTAVNGGLLSPFSRYDERVPEILRKATIELSPGQVSAAIRVGSWFHLLKHEGIVAAESVGIEEVSSKLAAEVRERMAGPAMEALNDRLLRQCRVEIHDPELREMYQRRRRIGE